MKTAIEIGEKNSNREAREERTIAETRFMWIPGRRPDNVPVRIPRNKVKIISSII